MIHIITSDNPDHMYLNYWVTEIPDYLRGQGFDVNVINGSAAPVPDMPLHLREIYYETTQFNQFYADITGGYVNKRDIILFSDAYNGASIQFRKAVASGRVRCNFVGVWGTPLRKDVRRDVDGAKTGYPVRYARYLEQCLHANYRFNLFPTITNFEKYDNQYKWAYTKTDYIIGYPSGDAFQNLNIDLTKKENLVVIGVNRNPHHQAYMIDNIRTYMSGVEFVDLNTVEVTRDEYYDLLRRAKVFLSVSEHDYNMMTIYEAMRYGCIPMVPDTSQYTLLLDMWYYYPMEWVTGTFVEFIHIRDAFESRVLDMIENYDVRYIEMQENITAISSYFSNDGLVNLLTHIQSHKPRNFYEQPIWKCPGELTRSEYHHQLKISGNRYL